jgi:hypothetical protein
MSRNKQLTFAAAALAALALTSAFGYGQKTKGSAVPSRVTAGVDDTRLFRLAGNVHPLPTGTQDLGRLNSGKMLERMVLVLQRSREQELALQQFNERQYDPQSPDFHHWLHAEEFGRLYGPSDDDIATVTSWLQNHGFSIYKVSKGRVTIEFSGTVAQVESALHVEMHHYLVNDVEHLANDRDPAIPEALSPVILGIASLHDFYDRPQVVLGDYVKRDPHTGKITIVAPPSSSDQNPHTIGIPQKSGATPLLTYTDGVGDIHEDLTPYDFATIYNILPLWTASTPINGKGVKIAISGVSDIASSDVSTFRKSFGLPTLTWTTVHNGKDPGADGGGGQGENTLDVEMAGATAPGATVILVVSASTTTTGGDQLSDSYIIDNEVAPIMSASYGECELGLGTAGNAAINKIWQQGATEGISIFESAGDQGSAGCSNSDAAAPNIDTYGLQVNGIASSPYLTAVGGTDFTWSFINEPISTYWNTSNNGELATANGYLPEVPWNSTCANPLLPGIFTGEANTEQLCNDALNSPNFQGLVRVTGGSGGMSHCTTPSGTTSATCSGGYAKPSWQAGAGVPADGKRDLPDVSLFASGGFSDGINGSAILFCNSTTNSNGCDYSDPNEIIYQEVGGTSASSPLMAGVMALILQKTGASQGLANPELYTLYQKQVSAGTSCNSSTVANGNSCVFYDISSGTNSQVCLTGDPNCVTNTSGDEVGLLSGYAATTGYDLAIGLGSVNVTNLVNAWPATATKVTPTVSITPSATSITTTQSFTVTVAVSGGSGAAVPTGAVTLSSGSYNAEQTLASGRTVFSLGAGVLPVGSDRLTATYTPDVSSSGLYFGATQSVNVTVTPATASFQPVQGFLSQISVGADGSVWGINSAHQIFTYSSGGWTQIPGYLSQIAVGSRGAVWGINASQQIYRWDSTHNGWNQIPGALVQIAVGADGDVWGINASQQIFHYDSQSLGWNEVAGSLSQIAVGSAGAAYGINLAGQLFWYNPGSGGFQYIPGTAGLTHVSVGVDGDVWGIANQMAYHYDVMRNRMDPTPGSLTQITVGSGASVYGLNYAGQIYEWRAQSASWLQIPGTLNSIAGGGNGTLWGLNSQHATYQLTGQPTRAFQTLSSVNGTINQISVGADGAVWGIASGTVEYFNSGTQAFVPVAGAPALAQLSVGAGADVWGISAGGSIYEYVASTGTWNNIPGELKSIQVGANGAVWGINYAGQIFTYDFASSSWDNIPGALSALSVGADGTVWGINGGQQIYRFDTPTRSWVNVPGRLTQLSVGSASNIWGVNYAGQVFEYNNGTQSWTQIPNAVLSEVRVTFDGGVWGVNRAGQLFRWNTSTEAFDFVGSGVTNVVAGNAAAIWATNTANGAVSNWF